MSVEQPRFVVTERHILLLVVAWDLLLKVRSTDIDHFLYFALKETSSLENMKADIDVYIFNMLFRQVQ